MNKLLLFGLLLLFVPLVTAVTNDAEVYYSFDDANLSGSNPQDLSGNTRHGTNNGADTGISGILNEGFDIVSTNGDDVSIPSYAMGSAVSFSMWINADALTGTHALIGDPSGTYSIGVFVDATGSVQARLYQSQFVRVGRSGSGISTGAGWQHVVITYDGGTNNDDIDIWIDGSEVDDTNRGEGSYTAWNNNPAVSITLGEWNGASNFEGQIDEYASYSRALSNAEIAELYNSGSGFNPYDVEENTTSVLQSERLEQTFFLEQTGVANINSVSYSPVVSASTSIDNTTLVYGTATIPINPTTSNQADCRITIDGGELNNSEISRSLTAGQRGNLLITSFTHNVTVGTHNFGLECKKTGGAFYEVENATLYIHELATTTGVTLTTTQHNITSQTISSGLLDTFSLTTSVNNTETDLIRALVLEWAANYDYTADGNITITTEIGGTNCTPIKRYGSNGDLGSVAGACYLATTNTTNSTNYDVNIYGDGTGNLENAIFHLKEFIIHPEEINQTSLNGETLSGSGTIKSVAMTLQAGHSSPKLVTIAVIDALSTSGTVTGSFYLTDRSTSSNIIQRAFNENDLGVAGVQKQFTPSGTTTIDLNGTCSSCSFGGGDLLIYLTDTETATPNSFDITAQDVYGQNAINEFTIKLDNNNTFTTTTGTITIFTEDDLINVTFEKNSGVAIPYYANSTLNHNKSFDLVQNLTPFTIINATFGGVGVNNFTANGTVTTNGKVYLDIFSTTAEVSLTNAVSDSGANLTNDIANITANPYLEYYTFTLLTGNVFNFSIYDEITEALITENMTLEIIRDTTATTYTTTNGTLLLELLVPDNYTIRYYSTLDNNYTQRDYLQVLEDRERYDVSLYSLDFDEATDMIVTIKDTAGDPVEDATVKLLRYYTSCACYNVVEMAETSASGESYFIVDAYDGHYKFAVEYQGQTEFLSSSPENFVPVSSLVERTITINLGAAYFESYRELTDIARTINYNNDTKGLTFTWNDPSGIVTEGCLYASYLDGVHYTDVTPACQSSATGSVVLVLNNTARSYKYYAELETSTTYSDYVVFTGTIDSLVTTLMDGNTQLGAFLGGGIIVMFALLFSFSAIAVLIITSVGVIGMYALGIFSITGAFIMGFATLIIGIAAYLMRS